MEGTSRNAAVSGQCPLVPFQEEKEEEDLRYGFGACSPGCLQLFNRIRWFVLWASLFSFLQGFIVNGVINAVVTSLETRFELPSTRSGLIPSSNNFIALVVVLLITYYGAGPSKPRIIAAGVLLVALGSLIFSLPHFITGLYVYRSSEVEENVCYPGSANSTEAQCQDDERGAEGKDLQSYLYIFMLGNALHGVGATPIFTLGTAYIDENTKAEKTSWYLGIIYAAASLGVAGGYMAGGQFLNIYTDIDRVDMATIDLTPMDPRWVGAWWIPFLICGVVMLILVLPLAGYPAKLPGSDRLMANRKSEAHEMKTRQVESGLVRSWRNFPRALLSLLRNPTFVFLSLASCAEGIIVSGVAAFGAKFLQEKFNAPAAFAGFVMGVITVPGAGGGMLLGGFLVRRFKLKCRGIIRLNLLAACLTFLAGGLFLIQCPTQPMAGVTVHYDPAQSEGRDLPAMDSACNDGCGCSTWSYEPVCGADGLVYFSPCHAGCDDNYAWMEGPIGPFKMYQNCSCVVDNLARRAGGSNASTTGGTSPPAVLDVVSPAARLYANDSNTTSALNATAPPPGAHQGVCMSDCKLLYVFAPLLFLGMLLTFTTVSPTQTATLRCVPESEKALAIGFQWLFLRLGGTMPGPLVLGAVIDSACRVWQQACGTEEEGACWIYTHYDMGVRIFAWWLLVKAFGVVCYFLAQFLYRPGTASVPRGPEVTGRDPQGDVKVRLRHQEDSD